MHATYSASQPTPKNPIVKRLDAIETAKRAAVTTYYQTHYPELGYLEIGRLADLMSSTPIRLIAESALSLLPEEQTDGVLARFESPNQPTVCDFSPGGDYWFAYGAKAQAWVRARYIGEKASPFFDLREPEAEFRQAAIEAGFTVEDSTSSTNTSRPGRRPETQAVRIGGAPDSIAQH